MNQPTSGSRRIGLSENDCECILKEAVEAFGRGEFAACERLLLGLAAVAPDDARAFKLLGSTLLFQDRRREARRAYEAALALEPNDPYVLVALAEIELDALHFDAAVALFAKLFEFDPQGRHPATNRGRQVLEAAYVRLAKTR